MGGKLLLGGKADGRSSADDPDRRPVTAQVCSNEAFAPLVVAFPFRDFGDAIRRSTTRCSGSRPASSRTTWPRLAGVRELEVGGVIVNDVPTYRIDHMPYGGVKDSRPRPRGPALGDRRHDRDPDHGARPAAVRAFAAAPRRLTEPPTAARRAGATLPAWTSR
jgi:hypothetical protein